MNPNIRDYAHWRNTRRGDYQRAYAAWLEKHCGSAPRKPDWSWSAYVKELSEGRKVV